MKQVLMRTHYDFFPQLYSDSGGTRNLAVLLHQRLTNNHKGMRRVGW